MKSCVWLAVVGLLAFAFPDRAQAAPKVAVLGVRSLDGEYELERRLSSALRASAARLEDYVVSERAPSLEQMTLAHRCDEPDAKCLTEIAKTLGVERLFYGSVVGAGGGHELTIYVFDASSGLFVSKTARDLGTDQLNAATVEAALAQLLRPPAHSEEPALGRVSIVSNAAGGAVQIDGRAQGKLDEDGLLALDVAAGEHTVRVSAAGSERAGERVATVEAGDNTVVEIYLPGVSPALAPAPQAHDPEPPLKPRRTLQRVFGWISVGLSTAFAAATVYSWVRIDRINDDSRYNAYRHEFPRAGTEGGVSDVCTAAARGALAMRDPSKTALERDAHDMCEEAGTLEKMQYGFLGAAAATAVTGTVLLLTARPRRTPSIALRPRLGADVAVLEARLSF